MSTPESNEVPQVPDGQHPVDGAHTSPLQDPSQPPAARQPAAPPPAAPPQAAVQQPQPPQPQPGQPAAPPYPAAAQPGPYQQPAPGQPGPYQYPTGHPGAQYGYPVAQPARTPTGTLSWALGFLIFLLIPFLSGIISGTAMAATFGASAKHGGVARENARSAANWGLTYVTLSLMLVIGHFISIAAFSGGNLGHGFFPVAIPLMIYFAISILHVVLVIVGTVKSSSGKVMRVPFAIPYIRA